MIGTMTEWHLLDGNAWTSLLNGVGLTDDEGSRLREALHRDAIGKRTMSLFTAQPVEQELYKMVDSKPDEMWRTLDLTLRLCGSRLLRAQDVRTADEVRLGRALDEQERFIDDGESRRRSDTIRSRNVDWVREQVRIIRDFQQADRNEAPGVRAQVTAALDARVSNWREEWPKPDAVEAIARGLARDLVAPHVTPEELQRADVANYPTPYWRMRVHVARAVRVFVEGGRINDPGTYDHHLFADAAAYADVLVTDDTRMITLLAAKVGAPCRVVRFVPWARSALTSL